MGVLSTEEEAAFGEGARILSCLHQGGTRRRGGRQRGWKWIAGTEKWWKALGRMGKTSAILGRSCQSFPFPE